MNKYYADRITPVEYVSQDDAHENELVAVYTSAQVDARIAELEKALQEIIRTTATIPGDVCGGTMHPFVAQYLVSARAVDAARSLMERSA
jgi:hypothetical protein